jgi:hypothetical protein
MLKSVTDHVFETKDMIRVSVPKKQDDAIKNEENLEKGDEDNLQGIFNKYMTIMIKVFSKANHVLSFPLLVFKILNEGHEKFVSFGDMCSVIADNADNEFVHCGFNSIFISPETHYGSKLDLRIMSFGTDDEEDFLLTARNYQDIRMLIRRVALDRVALERERERYGVIEA